MHCDTGQSSQEYFHQKHEKCKNHRGTDAAQAPGALGCPEQLSHGVPQEVTATLQSGEERPAERHLRTSGGIKSQTG